MALKFITQFPIFAPQMNPPPRRPPTEIRFSRWNNANAEPFNARRRAQQQIEDDLRRGRRFDSADRIATIHDDRDGTSITTETYRSTGTPSSPSRPSIPGKKSKYSKDESYSNRNTHPAFRRVDIRARRNDNRNRNILEQRGKSVIGVSEDGVSFKVEGAPFEMMYSYTETPKVKPLALRQRPFSPFGPETMARPWTGKAPLPGSKKRLKEFDSFVLPPPYKKGVKPVQKPGPFLPGSGPKYVRSREEILGDPLTDEEVKDLIKSVMKSDRQLNMGRDGLTHNMLDNIHAHWKRRRVCKIKCKGVCTVDMVNIREQLEDKTGGKIIFSRGGVLFLFRGRNYNYKTRPRYPIMLWKPATPVYPRLIKQAPDGLTLEEAGIMRKKGRNLIPICKLGKNGVYADLANNVREAFEACDLVRINCQGLNPSDYRKIGAKLKDIVPCVLVSFEHEHILMWRGRDWKSSLPEEEDSSKGSHQTNSNNVASNVPASEGQEEISEACTPEIADDNTFIETLATTTLSDGEDAVEQQNKDSYTNESIDRSIEASAIIPNIIEIADDKSETTMSSHETETMEEIIDNESKATKNSLENETIAETTDDETEAMSNSRASEIAEVTGLSKELVPKDYITGDKQEEISDTLEDGNIHKGSTTSCTEGFIVFIGTSPITYTCNSPHKQQQEASSGPGLISNSHKQQQQQASSGPGLISTSHKQQQQASSGPGTPADCTFLRLYKAFFPSFPDLGSAVILDESALDDDIVYKRAVAFSKSAPPGPVFRYRPKRAVVQKLEKEQTGDSYVNKPKEVFEKRVEVQKYESKMETGDIKVKELKNVAEKSTRAKKNSRPNRMNDFNIDYPNGAPRGSLGVDELAKLLS